MKIKLKQKHITDRFCVYCQRDFKTAGGLARHIYMKHKNTYAYENLLEITDE